MKNEESFTVYQLSVLLVIFEMGSAIVVGIGTDAKQDAWMAILITSVLGVGLVWGYYKLLELYEYRNFFEIITSTIGKWIGNSLILGYVMYFLYIGTRVLRDFCELLTTSIYPRTPIEVFSVILSITFAYILSKGLISLGRTMEIFFPYFFSFLLFIGLGIIFSGDFIVTNLFPILAEGPMPLIQAIFPGLITFPFGELVVFLIFIPLVKNPKNSKKSSLWLVGVSGVILSYVTLLQIATLGEGFRGRTNFPLLSSAQEISLLNFIERIDIIVVFIILIGIFAKILLFLFAAIKGLAFVSNRSERSFIFPVITLIALLSETIASNLAEHLEEGLKLVPYWLHIPFQFIFPVLLFLIGASKQVIKGKKSHGTSL